MNNSSSIQQILKSKLHQQYQIVTNRIQNNRLYNQKLLELQRQQNQREKKKKQLILNKQKFYKENPNFKKAIKEKRLVKANKKLEKQVAQFKDKLNTQLTQTQNNLQNLLRVLTNVNAYLSLVPQAHVMKYPDNKQQSEQSSYLSRFYKIYYGDDDLFFGNDLNLDQNMEVSNKITNSQVNKDENIEKKEQLGVQKIKTQSLKQQLQQRGQCSINFNKSRKIKLKNQLQQFSQQQGIENHPLLCEDNSQDSQDLQQKIRLQNKSLICYIKYIKIQKFTRGLKSLFEQNYCNKLTWLTLSHCNLRTLENIPNFTNLRSLDISHNELVGSFEFVVKINTLEYMNVSHNQISRVEKFQPFKKFKKGIAIYLMDNPIVINFLSDLHLNRKSQNRQRNLTLVQKKQQERKTFEQKLSKIFANWNNQQYQKQGKTTKFKKLQNDKVLFKYFQIFKNKLAESNIIVIRSILTFQLLNANISEITNYKRLEELINQLNEERIDQDSGSVEEEEANFKTQLQSRKWKIQKQIITNNKKLLRKIRKNMYILLMNFTLQQGKKHLLEQKLSQKNLSDYQKAKEFYDNRSKILQMQQREQQGLIEQLMERAKEEKNPFMYTAVKILKKQYQNKKNLQQLINAHRSQLDDQNLGVSHRDDEDINQQMNQDINQDVVQQASDQSQSNSNSPNVQPRRHANPHQNHGNLDDWDRNMFLQYAREQSFSVQEEFENRIFNSRSNFSQNVIIQPPGDRNSQEFFQNSDLGDNQDADQSHQS